MHIKSFFNSKNYDLIIAKLQEQCRKSIEVPPTLDLSKTAIAYAHKMVQSIRCNAVVECFKFLENMGVEFSNDDKRLPTYNSETMESNISGLYLAGVICGGMETHKWFIENSRIHAPIIINSILDTKKAIVS